MARQTLASMPMSALVKLRDRVSTIISRRADALKRELRSLGDDYKEVGRIAIYGKKKVKADKARRKAAAQRRRAARKTAARKSAGRKTLTRKATAKRKSARRKARA